MSISIPARFPSWQPQVQAAVDEPDHEKLLGLVHAAEMAIFNRLQELAKLSQQDGSHSEERDSLAHALETLRLLKQDRLGFPDWTKSNR